MNHLNRDITPIRMRNYGRILQNMIQYACTISDQTEQYALTQYIAQCMMQKNMIWNADQESGIERVKGDIQILSNGVLPTDGLELRVQTPAYIPFAGRRKKK